MLVYFSLNVLKKYLFSIIYIYIFFFQYSVTKFKATFGQQLLGIRFKPDQLTGKKVILFQLFTVGAKYVQSKVESPSKNFYNSVKYFMTFIFYN